MRVGGGGGVCCVLVGKMVPEKKVFLYGEVIKRFQVLFPLSSSLLLNSWT